MGTWSRTWALGCCLVLAHASAANADRESWNYLIEKLVADGFERDRVEQVFVDPRIPAFDGLEFEPVRRGEPRSMYRRFLQRASVDAARACRQRYAPAFEAAEERFGVSANVVASILFVESACGRNAGRNRVLHRLARLAMANDPDNLRRNVDRLSDGEGWLDRDTDAKLRARAEYLEQTFYPEVRALLTISDRLGIDPHEVRGSGSGAFGFPQFLPSSYLAFGVDGNGDGRVSLYDIDDAAASCARYLAGHGWHPGATAEERRQAVWHYNHSKSYVDSVLTLAAELGRPAPKAVAKAKPKKRARGDETKRR